MLALLEYIYHLKFESIYTLLICTNHYILNVIYENVNSLFKYETIVFVEIINIEK